MLYEIGKQQLDEMKSWTAEKYELLAEMQWLRLGEAIARSERVWPEYRNGSRDEVRRLAGEDEKHALIAFLAEDRGRVHDYPVDEACHGLAKLYGEAARILRTYGVSSEEELPASDRQLFGRWVEVGEGCLTCRDYDGNEALFFPLPAGVTARMLALLYPDYTPEALRESAKRNEGVADLRDIHDQRDIKAISEGLRAQFGRRHKGDERMREYLKAELTADLAADPRKPFGPGCSDRRLLAVSGEVLSQAEHDKLMAEIEAGFPGWCRECGTPPDRNGCSACRPARQATADTRTPADPPSAARG